MKLRKNDFLQLHGQKMELDESGIDLDLKGKHPQIVAAQPARFAGEAYATSGLYMVEGEVEGTLTMECARCLTHFPYAYRVPVKETFVDEKEAEIELDEELEIQAFDGDDMELNPYLEADILLSLPHTLVCRDDCKGICPECGVNKNEQNCGCVVERIDPRLAVLSELFGKQNK
ncbi:DUF177 domain-containing protein [Aneurinibacillus sp. Ricciae_BoGa-3]|uniref:YceD family protein n=1 Tax=Aneurinibacillus sp. Ricciae_BoGa-3 TaxID=3022697 RepID=UPI002340EB78|nr:DUF177 domain-containing protein [Aneurinibacillus sp. Ricciae_BoGa-3]WCK53018.1 DUF177 domain-containing protein [Aneurinibacillus sp. Ricciae_BoGa-3]